MKQGLKAQGFTVVEVLIVLAVSIALLVSGMLAISGQQHKTEFTQAVNDVKSQVDQVINNVSTGYYASNSDFPCTQQPTGPDFSPGTNVPEGTHYGCILVGRAIQFQNINNTLYYIFNLAGLQHQYVSGAFTSDDVNNLTQAHPAAIPGTIETKILASGLTAANVRYNDTTNVGILAIITDFAQASSDGLQPSARSAQLWAVTSGLNLDQNGGRTALNSAGTNNYVGPVKTVHICLKSAGTDQVGILIIGGNGRQLATTLNLYSNKASANAAVASGADCP